MRRTLALVAVGLGLVVSTAPAARADIITFAGIPFATFGPGVTTVEGNFAYDVLPGSGALFGQLFSDGNPIPHVEGRIFTGGGTLRVVRTDVPSGLFAFEGLDVAQFNRGSTIIQVFGLRGGVPQGVDDFGTSTINHNWLTVDSLNLSGVQIDELRIRLDAVEGVGFGWEEADNVRLTPVTSAVPAPPAVLLVGLGTGCIAAKRYFRRRKTA